MTTPAVTEAPENSVLNFWARVGGNPTLVRVFRTGIEWSMADHLLDTSRIPMALITAVTTESGRFLSTLVVEAEGRSVEFRVDNACAHEARQLIRFLMAVLDSGSKYCPKLAGKAAFSDELLDLRTSLDDGTVGYSEYEELRARILGL
jgi:hypothetical protein